MASAKKKSAAPETERRITFEITTTTPLPVGQQVFISGNLDMLGAWRPDGFPLTRLDDNVWTGYAFIGGKQPVEFKITRGDWSNEAADADGNALKNNFTMPARGHAHFKHTVVRWVDRT